MVIKHALKDKDNVLYIDLDKIVKSRRPRQFISNFADQIGYFPEFSWLNSINKMIDLGVQGFTGSKSGLSETVENQFKAMLNSTMMAIRKISLKNYDKTSKRPLVKSGIGNKINLNRNGNRSANDNSLSMSYLKEEDYLQQHPEEKPIIVIDRFLSKSDNYSFVYKEIADWAALLVSMNLAQVIFLTEDVSSLQLLADSLPNQVFKVSTLEDASTDSSREYVLNQLMNGSSSKHVDDIRNNGINTGINNKKFESGFGIPRYQLIELDDALGPIGGRMLDLQAFVRRVKSGELPKQALDEMIKQTAEQVTQIFIIRNNNLLESAQAWNIIKLLSEEEAIPYSKVYHLPLFKSNSIEVLSKLERENLIRIVKDRGVIDKIKPGKPLLRAAFNNIVNDQKIYNVLETSYLTNLIKFEVNRIKTWEDEIKGLGYAVNNKEFKTRVSHLANKISESTKVIESSEAEIKSLSKKR
ncbi:Yme2p ASCRUDRAFT_77159 [Ascoidea rubescens DSM 1968]|uniref:Mitochondrial escape protein 2 n=1 Tax=Ascoidea rubescens DSM 1968 TaxID=1344418 RepID=A0A1D2VCJ7_9ASCO|nr:hypothetical protein ASCRUDRAFT_77159 [Ascoidea rubescens DSM 1968]ODV59418.1 hypothetical protein ASCRUDRAFT_77159 [Ascoidea rubescens DSM 1968]